MRIKDVISDNLDIYHNKPTAVEFYLQSLLKIFIFGNLPFYLYLGTLLVPNGLVNFITQ